ncbi:hypothetical protein A3Q35_05750 [Aeribacillus pallidus]|nr:hypothetical protein A3Q35_05750 [Aeribacillus pallidus]
MLHVSFQKLCLFNFYRKIKKNYRYVPVFIIFLPQYLLSCRIHCLQLFYKGNAANLPFASRLWKMLFLNASSFKKANAACQHVCSFLRKNQKYHSFATVDIFSILFILNILPAGSPFEKIVEIYVKNIRNRSGLN